jgi:aspartyl-tRNA(Asn)/glutamyl-tRNA(Gln) amidotransferase subunit B
MNATSSKLIKGATGDWEMVIGLEIHAQVTSNSKLFSGASTEFGGEPNAHVSLVDAAMPGMLPVINEFCVKQAVRTGLGLKATVNPRSTFDRKNYFYPDLPQGYQISQFKSPIVSGGYVIIDIAEGQTKSVGIERLHLEQDAGKLLHDQSLSNSFVDLNRSGVALMEIVSKPEMHSPEQAQAFVMKLRSILRYLETCDGDMEKGNLRADVNVSVRRAGATELGTRCEIKNVNSIRFIGQAIDHEALRQVRILEDGGAIDQETRLFDPNKGETRSMRSKEEAHDYRYFPDPDLLPLELSQQLIDGLKAELPELPDEKRAKFISQGHKTLMATLLATEKEIAEFYEELVERGIDPITAGNWVTNEVLGRANKTDRNILARWAGSTGRRSGPTGPRWSVVTLGPTGPAANAAIVQMISSNAITGKTGKYILDTVWERALRDGPKDNPREIEEIVETEGLTKVTDLGEIEKVVDDIIAANPDKVAQAKAKPTMIQWFVGQAMKASGGKANPQSVNDLLKSKLGI